MELPFTELRKTGNGIGLDKVEWGRQSLVLDLLTLEIYLGHPRGKVVVDDLLLFSGYFISRLRLLWFWFCFFEGTRV